MNIFYSLVFSNSPLYRITRHVFFWLLWICFFAFIETYRMYEMWHKDFFAYFPIAIGSMLIQVPIDIAFCYSVIYFLLPHFFLKGRYAAFVIGWIVLVFAAGTLFRGLCIQNMAGPKSACAKELAFSWRS